MTTGTIQLKELLDSLNLYITRLVNNLKNWHLLQWLGLCIFVIAVSSLVGVVYPPFADLIQPLFTKKGDFVFIVSIAAAIFILGLDRMPEDDPPIKRSEFNKAVEQMDSENKNQKKANEIQKSEIDRLGQELEKTNKQLQVVQASGDMRDLFPSNEPLTGNDVYLIQSKLLHLGFLPVEQLSGVYDTETEKAIKKYQLSRSLKCDGIVGPTTRQKLNKDTLRA